MDRKQKLLNRFLVEVFYEILRTEETCISRAGYKNLSLKELHVIEAVCRAAEEERDDRSSAIARSLGVTSGTLTTAVALLEKKGYLIRRRDSDDKRVVRILPTQLGWTANQSHAAFHREMVEGVETSLSDAEFEVFLKGLQSVAVFFQQKNKTKTGGHR